MGKITLKLVLELLFIFIGSSVAFNYSKVMGNIFIIGYFASKLFVKRYLIYTMIANKYFKKDNLNKTISYYDKAIKIKSCKARVIINYAYILLRDSNVDKANKVISLIDERKLPLELNDEMNYKMVTSLIEWKNGNLDNCINILKSTYEKYKNTTLYESLGYLLVVSGDYEDALNFNLEAIKYDENNSVIMDNLGETYYYLGEYDKALDIYTRLCTRAVTFPEAYYYYGLVLKNTGDSKKALEMFKKSLTLKESFLSNLKKESIEKEIELLK
ncbi:tetratricopeptide repeat protein [Clostridium algidicarnis]|uniref:Tetratricopeptide repeat protein n=1 Tax=Clostridium algidicarnis TaxID=37659 RepID=A0ABS6C068_9CLOT|nr:tetratricopeptide repeat protein [Clostridium algidicarnis]MBB6631583.1 tetratricopeptide repeat protein [Clostridium algidicarnis]MBU3195139.1 tetratricopeptide repeat protein [Clostridium algidicarnis]MBU3218876.1 tetratricopeptide repeat protein [Clostridium algidicarnis]MCB2285994.1 tetratricopeptide repeat protein [Clostridium algidicarnis]